jgi:DNA helicase II / ATP-dependent DNA helicase PcrA
MESIDVAACPGSGKTTLLVAKLAILAEKWQYRTRGICVLSHTNAARHEIENHLGNTAAGRRLLNYPHYIGTIHGFVNEFLAVPWLRSQGYPIKMIDTEVCHRRRWNSLPFKTRRALEQNHHGPSVLSIKNSDFCIGQVHWGKGGELGVTTLTYDHIQKACCHSAVDGYFCYDEMFMWAGELIGSVPEVVDALRNRFPILLIDEAQDNSKEQSAILSRIFMEGDNAVIRQRFGDANQAIFDFQGAEEAATDKFPGMSKMELPNSHRFGQTIADMADPLGLQPYALKGLGPKKSLASGSEGQHTIFLFDEHSATKVLEAYGSLLLETFSDLELREEWFTATAIGQIHRPSDEEKENKFPHHIGHYWPDYDPELTKHDPTPQTFMQYVFAGQGKSELQHETHAMVEKIAEGFLRLSDFTVGGKALARRKHHHRQILELLVNSPDIREQYQNLVVQFTVKQESPTKETWEGYWFGVVRSIAEVIAGSPLSEEADGFLKWNNKPVAPAASTDAAKIQNNIFCYRKNEREVSIQAGSIHSVKGQTHTATLVLETFWYGHNLELILPWITQKKNGWKKADGIRQEARLKLHYVAMTRPTHLLCLAMKQGASNNEHMGVIRTLGWRLLQVQPDGSTTLLEPA